MTGNANVWTLALRASVGRRTWINPLHAKWIMIAVFHTQAVAVRWRITTGVVGLEVVPPPSGVGDDRVGGDEG